MPFSEPGGIFASIPIIFAIIFLLVIGSIIYQIIASVRESSYNRSQPKVATVARIVSKRVDVRHHSTPSGNPDMHHHHTSSRSTYYVTFEMDTGDRLELRIPDNQYGYLVEGDQGTLVFQGRKFIQFDRA